MIPNTRELIPGSKYFTWHEALYLKSINSYAIPTELQKITISNFAKKMDRIRDHFGLPIKVHSWLRPDLYNKMIGGAAGSLHCEGRAIDFSIPGGSSIEEIKRVLYSDKNLWPGRGELDTTDWVHLDDSMGPWFYGNPKRV